MSDINDSKPKYKPHWMKLYWHELGAKISHLCPYDRGAMISLMEFMWDNDDCALPDDANHISKIIRGFSDARPKWEAIKARLGDLIRVEGGRVSCPWLTLKRSQSVVKWELTGSQTPPKSLKDNVSTPENQNQIIRSGTRAASPSRPKAGTGLAEKEASREERKRTPEEQAAVAAQIDKHKKRIHSDQVRKTLGITDEEATKLMEAPANDETDEGGCEDITGGCVA